MTITAKLDKTTYVPGDTPRITVTGVLPEGGTVALAPASGVLSGTLSNGQRATVTLSLSGVTGTAGVVPVPVPTDNRNGVWRLLTRSALDASDVGTLVVTVKAGKQSTTTSAKVVAAPAPAPAPTNGPTPEPVPPISRVYPAAGTWVVPTGENSVGNKKGTNQTRSSLGTPNGADGWYEGVLFTSRVQVSAGRFRSCTFEQNGSASTVGGSAFAVTSGAVRFEDCTFRIPGGFAADGGPAKPGLDKGIQATRGGLEVVRCDVSGACIPVYFETQEGQLPTLVQDSYLHDIWSSNLSRDHTDIINGNFEASNVTVRGCLMDGRRTGGSVSANGFGVYDDINGWENWTIDHCDIANAATGFLCNDDESRARGPLVVTNNIWRGPFSNTRWGGRSPSVQSNNVDAAGRPVTL